MRLINTRTLALEEYFGNQIPKYAILSHTWRDDEEVTYQEWQQNNYESDKMGFQKIQAACLMAQRDSIEFLWVDTNCINKDSSAELSEAINSMFTWYHNSSVCYVYLDDFHFEDKESLIAFGDSRWFTRGWTLQELLAPRTVQFFDASWSQFGTKQSLLLKISTITSIPIQYLVHPDSIRLANVAMRMSWVATRTTTREEDIAYCLLGIFEINMPLLYGEGGKAFIRLQEEIIRHSNDHTIFCWSWPSEMKPEETPDWQGCLAPSPITFREGGRYLTTGPVIDSLPTDFQLTNSGLRITLPLFNSLLQGYKFAVLNAKVPSISGSQICLCLQEVRHQGFARSRFPNNRLMSLPQSWAKIGVPIYLAHERDPSRRFSSIIPTGSIYSFRNQPSHAILPISLGIAGRMAPVASYQWDESERPDTYGAAIALKQDDRANRYHTLIKMQGTQGMVNISFKARIQEQNRSTWDSTSTEISYEVKKGKQTSQSLTEDVPTGHDYDFTLESYGNQTLVRPVLISFSKFLDKKDA